MIDNDFQLKRALENFEKRKASAPKQIDNASLPAGSPMTYYCRKCGQITGQIAESAWQTPPTICDQCLPLHKMGEI